MISYGPRRVPCINGMIVARLYRLECAQGPDYEQPLPKPGKVRFADQPPGIGTRPSQCVRAIIARIDGAYLGHQTRAVRDRIASRSGRHG